MTEWITARDAAQVLGVHPSAVAKMVRRGDLTTRRQRPSLARSDVEALRDRRAVPFPPPAPKPAPEPWAPQPPDQDHDWLDSDGAAALLGLGRSGVNYRAQRGKLPAEWHDGRRWFRRDHLELVKRADDVRRSAQRAD